MNWNNIIAINIGPKRGSSCSEAICQYSELAQQYSTQADFLVLNLSSPFLATVRKEGGAPWLKDVLFAIKSERPVAVKMHLHELTDPVLDCLKISGCEAIIGVHDQKASLTAEQIKSTCQRLAPLPFISVGRIASKEDIELRLEHGAALVEIFSLLVKEGPQAVRNIAEGLFSS